MRKQFKALGFSTDRIIIEELERSEKAEVEEERVEELQEEVMIGAIRPEGKSSISREMALNVISSTLSTAQASVSGTTSGNSVHATGGTTNDRCFQYIQCLPTKICRFPQCAFGLYWSHLHLEME